MWYMHSMEDINPILVQCFIAKYSKRTAGDIIGKIGRPTTGAKYDFSSAVGAVIMNQSYKSL